MSEREQFVHEEAASRVVFGAGARWRIAEELEVLGIRRVAVVSGPRSKDVAQELSDACGHRSVAVLPDAQMHVPSPLAARTAETVGEMGADGIVAVGGGSAIGLAKAVARRRDVVIFAIPTSYSGSEMTPVWGETFEGTKTTGRSPAVRPRVVIYDVELTMSLTKELSVASGMNAAAHAVEGLYAPDASPLRTVIAEEALRCSVAALPRLAADPADQAARAEMLRAAWMCGTVLGSTSMGLHHRLCHLLGGSFDLPHAQTHMVLLPHVMAFNMALGGEALRRAARAVGDPTPARALWRHAAAMGGPTSLRTLGLAPSDVSTIVDLAASAKIANPRPFDARDLERLLLRALGGEKPITG